MSSTPVFNATGPSNDYSPVEDQNDYDEIGALFYVCAVIVGAGSAGCVLANRLSQNGRFTVLLLEAGGEETECGDIDIPFACPGNCCNPDVIWDDYLTPQEYNLGFDDKRSMSQHGKVLGGSSSVNWMLYVRGNSADFDSWKKLGCDGWGWKDVTEYFKKQEDYDHESDDFGHGGPLTVSKNQPPYKLIDELIAASTELGIPENKAYNNGNNYGIAHTNVSIRNGYRCHTARAYLRPAMSRRNLDVVVRAHTTKILFEGKRAIGVRFIRDGGEIYNVFADKEVIVSASTINSPHLLMLSGIGPKAELSKHKIPVIADLPVGENLQDHPAVMINVEFDNVDDLDTAHKFGHSTFSSLLNYKLFGRGPLSGSPILTFSFMDVQSGRYVMNHNTMSELQVHIASTPCGIFTGDIGNDRLTKCFGGTDENVRRYHTNDFKRGIMTVPTVLHPKSRGSITLASADPLDRPLIDPNMLSDRYDVEVLKTGVKYTLDLLKTKALSKYKGNILDRKYPTRDRISPQVDPESDEYIESYIKHFTRTVWHPVGTCKMGRVGDPSAVVDPQLRVQGGVKGLRVVDASIMPHLTSGNTNAPSIMIGEKASDMIQAAYK